MTRARRDPKAARGKLDENERNLRELSLFVEETGGFRLGLVTFDTAQTRQTQLSLLAERLAPRPVFLTTLDLAKFPDETLLLQRLQSHLRENPAPEGKTPAVMVVGLEAVLDYRETVPGIPSPQPILRNANIQRDAYPRLIPCPVVVWLFPTASRIFALEAPDLWHWRSGSFRFSGPSDGRRKLERSHVGMPQLQSDRLPRMEKAERIALLQDLLLELENALDRENSGNKARRAGLLTELGLAYHSVSNAERAMICLTDAARLYREVGNRRGEGTALGNLGNAYANLGQTEQAIGCYTQVLAIAREVGDRRSEGGTLGNIGNFYYTVGQTEQAIGFYEQHLTIARVVGDRRSEGMVLGNLGIACYDLGQVEKAIEYYEQALAIVREVGDRRSEGMTLGNLGIVYANLGQTEQAIGYYEQDLTIAREVGDRRGEGSALGNLGIAYARLGQTEKSRNLLNQALCIGQAIKDPKMTENFALNIKRLTDADPQ